MFDYFSVENGVPQGAVLSPVSFAVSLDPLYYRRRACKAVCHMGTIPQYICPC